MTYRGVRTGNIFGILSGVGLAFWWLGVVGVPIKPAFRAHHLVTVLAGLASVFLFHGLYLNALAGIAAAKISLCLP